MEEKHHAGAAENEELHQFLFFFFVFFLEGEEMGGRESGDDLPPDRTMRRVFIKLIRNGGCVSRGGWIRRTNRSG
ncbi:hypothetical protein HPP92_024622 [Vanilla planifolia]|uniref:Uncharacterized protein n=1 Tax=Vanilla planifolia TaxID=51239 RepID=A0A835PK08_VANPL|nr:hypothetical protein HPP92_024622 [Vanilla planifolia]